MDAELARRFRHHAPPTPEEGDRLTVIRQRFETLAADLSAELPGGRELALVMTKLEEAMFWANAAVARQWPLPDGEGE